MIAKHFIAHRINTVAALKNTPQNYGVEIDIRPYADRLIIHHDPFCEGDFLNEYLSHYNHGTLILNIKSEGIEFDIIKLLKKYHIDDYFFLDSSFPMITKLAANGITNQAIRFSEYEGMDTLTNMSGKIKWVWIDCFTQLPLNQEVYRQLKNLGYKLCLVSPELQGQEKKILQYRDFLADNNIVLDAICTKSWNITNWNKT